jgi:transcriptional regulator with XRE-family HTH domain
MQITTRINALREAHGLSESQLADASAIPRTTFRRRLVAPGTFALDELVRLAEVLDTTPSYLWLGEAA